MIWDSGERILFGITIAVAFMCGLQYLIKARRREIIKERVMIYGIAVLFLLSALGLCFWVLSDFYFEGSYINGTFRGDVKSTNITYFLIHKIGSVLLVFGPFLFMLAFEIIIKRTKYILTMLNSIFGVILIITSGELYSFMLSYIVSPITLILTVIIFLLYAKWSQYELKAFSSILLLGYIIIWIGLDLSSSSVKLIDTIPLIIAPLFILVGYLIAISPIFIQPRHFHLAKIYWFSSGSIIVIISWILLFVMINAGLSEINTIIEFVIIILGAMFMVYYSIRKIGSQPAKDNYTLMKKIYTKEKNNLARDILKVFRKPDSLTEEEVSISKEKMICLVCKGKLGGLIYMCPDCNSFYCKKCSDAIATLENACWVCDATFDESKPTKLPKDKNKESEIEKELEIEEEAHKKGKNDY
ncbi:MAG: hypothetical protein ACFFCV_05105 [Promethearchaeota archaeon]